SSQRAPLPQWLCISQLLIYHAEHTPEAPAILAPGRPPLTYGRLRQHIGEIGETLRVLGINRNERVAMALTDGPEMAVAFLAVAASAICVPLNPAYSADEYATYLADLHVQALLVQAGVPTPARAVARTCGCAIIELVPRPDAAAGLFSLTGVAKNPSVHHEFASPNDIALVLHTSGTTARPKRVPLTHMNICAAAHSWEAALALTASDRCLDVLPLFHIYGLIGTLFASMMAGASVICPPAFSAQSFFASLAEFCPT